MIECLENMIQNCRETLYYGKLLHFRITEMINFYLRDIDRMERRIQRMKKFKVPGYEIRIQNTRNLQLFMQQRLTTWQLKRNQTKTTIKKTNRRLERVLRLYTEIKTACYGVTISNTEHKDS